MTALDAELAARMAASTLGHVGRIFPHRADHVLEGGAETLDPALLHPAFCGSYDWHSCVHGWWQLLRLTRRFPSLPFAAEVRRRADEVLHPGPIAGELAYFGRPSAATFERPYGWAWLLALHGEAARHPGHGWADALAPLAGELARRFGLYLPKLTYPIRAGTHGNTAFALIHLLAWARGRDAGLAGRAVERALDWFAGDRDACCWEPGGDEFLSPILTEAALMGDVLGRDDFAPWLADLLPALEERRPETLFTPAFVSDRSDGRIVHLDGLNLSRAWCWRRIAARLPRHHDRRSIALEAAGTHLSAGLPHLAHGYMGEHWLATFALLALDDLD